MLRLLIAPEVLILVLIATQIIIPLWRGKPMFGLFRRLGRVAISVVPKPTSVDALLEASRQRLTSAQKRLVAAQIDEEAARREHAAAELEEEANRLRSGEDKLS